MGVENTIVESSVCFFNQDIMGQIDVLIRCPDFRAPTRMIENHPLL